MSVRIDWVPVITAGIRQWAHRKWRGENMAGFSRQTKARERALNSVKRSLYFTYW